MDNEINESYITMPSGFKAAGVACGLKTDLGNSGPMDLLDLNMVESDVPAVVAGVYTKNLIKGHSLQRTIRVIDTGVKVRALVVNSKNANACVGPKGYHDAVAIADHLDSSFSSRLLRFSVRLAASVSATEPSSLNTLRSTPSYTDIPSISESFDFE